ncbi:hypothetical protein [Streptomyces sp. NBC_01439]|uniref:hypothetical protein n=1 Tax=Streptomyces sp. NBC_01439 TaxID=2903867 RepID=UPI003FCC6BAE
MPHAPSSWRTRSQASTRGAEAASAWWWGSTARATRGCGTPCTGSAPSSSSPTSADCPPPPRRGPPPANTPWRWGYHRYDPKTGRLVDSLCTLGNGRFATRGSAPESVADGIHYPGTYLAGCRTALPALVASKRSFCRSGAGRAAVGRLTQTVNGERLEMGSSRTGVRRGPPRQARPRCG